MKISLESLLRDLTDTLSELRELAEAIKSQVEENAWREGDEAEEDRRLLAEVIRLLGDA